MIPNLSTISAQGEVIRLRMLATSVAARSTITAAAARRLMSRYLALPLRHKSDLVLSWNEAVSNILTTLRERTPKLERFLADKLDDYYSGPYCHELGEQALPGADEDAASAAIFAVIAYTQSSTEAACSGALQVLLEAGGRADTLSQERGEDLMSETAERRRRELQQIEIDWLNSVLTLVEREGVTVDSLSELERSASVG